MANQQHAETGTLSERSGRLYLTMDAGGDCEVQAWPVAKRYIGHRVHIVGRLGVGNILAAQSIRRL